MPYGLTAAIWTADVEAAERIGDRVETGTVFMNRCDYLDPGLAWTGVKDTGRGATLSPLGYRLRDAAEILPPAPALKATSMTTLRANWNYPDRGPLRRRPHRRTRRGLRGAGISRPLLVTDPSSRRSR